MIPPVDVVPTPKVNVQYEKLELPAELLVMDKLAPELVKKQLEYAIAPVLELECIPIPVVPRSPKHLYTFIFAEVLAVVKEIPVLFVAFK